MVYGFLNCFGGYALKLEAARGSLALANRMGLSLSARTAADVPRARNYGAHAARRSKGKRDEVGSLALADFSKNETQTW